MKEKLDKLANFSLFGFNGASIGLVALGYPFFGAAMGLLSEPAFAYFAWKSRSWALAALTAWWTVWWTVLMIKSCTSVPVGI